MKKSILAIDIGSSKVCAVIAEVGEENSVKIIGTGIVKSQGVKRGSITNIEIAAKAIRSAIADAKRVAGTEIKRATVSISGAYTKSLNSSGIVNIPNKEISIKEISRVMHTSLYNANIPNEYEVLHTLPFNFIVDDQEAIEDPLGMNASRLEVETHIITTQKSNLNNLKKAVRAAGVEVESVVLSGYASAIAVLNEDEKELGAAVIDIGAQTCNLIIHSGTAIRHNDFLAVGSHHITSDLSMAMHTPLNIAETVKVRHGSLNAPSDDLIELPMIGDEENTHEVSLGVVHNVIYARVEETLMIMASKIEKSGLHDQVGAGIVLTGGFTKLEGVRELAVAIFENLPVRLAKPTNIDGLTDSLREPGTSTAVGLVKYAAGGFTPYEIDVNRQMRYRHEEPIETPQLGETSANEEGQDDLKSIPLPPSEEDEPKIRIKSFSDKQTGRDKNGFFNKIWNWIVQLF